MILKNAIMAMGIVLVVGSAVLMARIVYLATGSSNQTPRGPALVADPSLALPPGAVVRSMALSAHRLAVHYDGPQAGGIAILDLTTGEIISRIRLETKASGN
jgi:hypothetical protein